VRAVVPRKPQRQSLESYQPTRKPRETTSWDGATGQRRSSSSERDRLKESKQSGVLAGNKLPWDETASKAGRKQGRAKLEAAEAREQKTGNQSGSSRSVDTVVQSRKGKPPTHPNRAKAKSMRSIPSSESSGAGSPVGEFKGRASSIDNCALKPVPKSADEAPTTIVISASTSSREVRAHIHNIQNALKAPDEIRIFRGIRLVKVAYLKKLYSAYRRMERTSGYGQDLLLRPSESDHLSVNPANFAAGTTTGEGAQRTTDTEIIFADWLKFEYPEATRMELQLLSVAARKRNADPRMVAEAQAEFRGVDTDGDGRVSLDEMEDYCLHTRDDVYALMRTLPEYVKEDLYREGGSLGEEDFIKWYMKQHWPEDAFFVTVPVEETPMTCVAHGMKSLRSDRVHRCDLELK